MIYFTSDMHLGHPGIIKMQNRPFADVEEMNRTLIHNYNSVVRKNDKVYILGDLCNHLSAGQANEMISGLNGKKVLIRGNHDKNYNSELFEKITDFMTASLNGRYFVLMHYPLMSWPKMHRGSIHLHGHSHGKKDYNLRNRDEGIMRFDAGVDANDYYPVSIEQIIEFFRSCCKGGTENAI